jgi:hypothetical protein
MNMPVESEGALVAIKRRLTAADSGPAVRESIRRHYEHLESLAASLRRIGMDGREIDEHIMLVFREYERELKNYMSNLPVAEKGPIHG